MKDEIDAAIADVIENSSYIMGKPVQKFEKHISSFIGCPSLGCASGSDALLLALLTAGIKTGDEIITTPFTFFATAGAVARLGAIPVFIDIEDKSFNIDSNKIEDAISQKTKGIIPVHLFGLPAEMDKIMNIAKQYKLIVIEDACQSLGADYKGKKVGSIGDFGCFSFYPTKNLGGYGDGGLIATTNEKYYNYLKKLRVHGAEKKYFYQFVGVNSRLDALQAAILNVKLKRINEWNSKRREIAEQYSCTLSKYVQTPSSNKYVSHVFHQYALITDNRDELLSYLKKKGIGAGIYYPKPLHLQDAFSMCKMKKGDLPVSESASEKIISLPIYPEMEQKQINFVIESVKNFFEK
jgi:hypothetical protein